MADGGFSDYLTDIWLKGLATVWIGLHYDDPNISGAYASEVFGGSYTRVQVQFSEPVSRAIFNSDDVIFRGMPTVRLTHVSGWDAQYNGNLLYSARFTEPRTVLAGKSFQIPAGTLALSVP